MVVNSVAVLQEGIDCVYLLVFSPDSLRSYVALSLV